MSVVIVGATGHLGRLTVEELLERGTPAEGIVAAGRDAGRLAALAERGVRTARVDLDDPATLAPAFAGADTLLLISTSEPGRRVPQHRAAIEAAAAAGIGHIVYTSAPRADDTVLVLAPDHRATEELLAASGIAHTVLRNNWYHENYVPQLHAARDHGEFSGSAGQGRVPSAARRDFAAAAAAVLADPASHAGAVYELTGDTAWTYAELADTLSAVLGTEVVYKDLSTEEHVASLVGAGLDEGTASFVAALDGNIRDGALGEPTGDLRRLIGRPATPIADTLRDLL
ncbi:NAD(P)H-binding protein [Nocardiopsis changdeensis]|uniref:NmrA family NAD(P)-binding protein n=1 Tax=Nocardiopsis changdeensis TaxID=2831969 RepID=A0ABX8BH50_9ACTN|nr:MULTISPECIES: NAD(P)H-binding protein [Nocardiopsis]QUX20684.1 NmrA family NAD(P)-binding protein [Nocardiopsis changdeensis]QYX36616.1 NAD(P)H-binding protein [Nocardiopsis sp. MT53]